MRDAARRPSHNPDLATYKDRFKCIAKAYGVSKLHMRQYLSRRECHDDRQRRFGTSMLTFEKMRHGSRLTIPPRDRDDRRSPERKHHHSSTRSRRLPMQPLTARLQCSNYSHSQHYKHDSRRKHDTSGTLRTARSRSQNRKKSPLHEVKRGRVDKRRRSRSRGAISSTLRLSTVPRLPRH